MIKNFLKTGFFFLEISIMEPFAFLLYIGIVLARISAQLSCWDFPVILDNPSSFPLCRVPLFLSLMSLSWFTLLCCEAVAI